MTIRTFEILFVLVTAGICLSCERSRDRDAPDQAPRREAEQTLTTVAPTVAPRVDAGQEEAAVWVNDVPIARREVDRRVEHLRVYYQRQRRPFGPRVEAMKRKFLVERLIDRELLRQHLAEASVEISDAEVAAEVERRIRRNFRSEEALERHLQYRGMTRRELFEQVRVELALARHLGADELRQKITDDELEALFAQVANRPPARERARVSSLLVRVPPGANQSMRDTIAREATQKLREVGNADAFRALAQSLSVNASKSGDLGWIERGALAPELEQAIFSAPQQSATSLVETPAGFQAFWIHEKRASHTRAFDEVVDVLRERAVESRIAERRDALLEQLRERADLRYAKDLER